MLSPVTRAVSGWDSHVKSPSSAESRSFALTDSTGSGPRLQYFAGPDTLCALFTHSDASSAVKTVTSAALTPLVISETSASVSSNGDGLQWFALSASYISDNTKSVSRRSAVCVDSATSLEASATAAVVGAAGGGGGDTSGVGAGDGSLSRSATADGGNHSADQHASVSGEGDIGQSDDSVLAVVGSVSATVVESSASDATQRQAQADDDLYSVFSQRSEMSCVNAMHHVMVRLSVRVLTCTLGRSCNHHMHFVLIQPEPDQDAADGMLLGSSDSADEGFPEGRNLTLLSLQASLVNMTLSEDSSEALEALQAVQAVQAALGSPLSPGSPLLTLSVLRENAIADGVPHLEEASDLLSPWRYGTDYPDDSYFADAPAGAVDALASAAVLDPSRTESDSLASSEPATEPSIYQHCPAPTSPPISCASPPNPDVPHDPAAADITPSAEGAGQSGDCLEAHQSSISALEAHQTIFGASSERLPEVINMDAHCYTVSPILRSLCVCLSAFNASFCVVGGKMDLAVMANQLLRRGETAKVSCTSANVLLYVSQFSHISSRVFLSCARHSKR